MPEPSGNFLYIDSLVCKQARMAMAKIMYSDMRKTCRIRKFAVGILYAGVAEALFTAAHTEILAPAAILLLSAQMLAQYSYQRSRHFQVSVRGLILWHRFDDCLALCRVGMSRLAALLP